MTNNIHFEKEGYEEILRKLKEKTKKISEIYKEIEEKSKEIDGNAETWKGRGQEEFYKSYLSISKKFEGIETSLDESNKFLEATINSYYEEDKLNSKSAENNKDNLTINQE